MKKSLTINLLIYSLMVMTMGESLHALPWFDHHTESACQADFLHIDSTPSDDLSDCSICSQANQLNPFVMQSAGIVSGEAWILVRPEIPSGFATNQSYYLSARAPPAC